MTRQKTKRRYGITLEIAQEHLDEWLEAELAVTTHQSYQLGGKSLTRADLGEIRETIDYWEQKVAQLQALEQNGGRGRMFRVVPRDY